MDCTDDCISFARGRSVKSSSKLRTPSQHTATSGGQLPSLGSLVEIPMRLALDGIGCKQSEPLKLRALCSTKKLRKSYAEPLS